MTQNVEGQAIRTQELAQLELDAYIALQAATVINEELLLGRCLTTTSCPYINHGN